MFNEGFKIGGQRSENFKNYFCLNPSIDFYQILIQTLLHLNPHFLKVSDKLKFSVDLEINFLKKGHLFLTQKYDVKIIF